MKTTITYSEKLLPEILSNMEKAGIATTREYINRALTLYNWAIQHSEKGRQIAAIDDENDSIFVIDEGALARVRHKAESDSPSPA